MSRPDRSGAKTRLVLVHDSIGGSTGMGRVAAAMARIALASGWRLTLVGDDVDGAFPEAQLIPVLRHHRLPALIANQRWAWDARRRLRAEDLSGAVVHAHAPLLMAAADVFTCHHLAEGAERHGLREPADGPVGRARRVQEQLVVRVDAWSYRHRPPATRVTFVSGFLRDEFTRLYGAPEGGDILPPPAPAWDPIGAGERAAARRRWDVDEDQPVVGYFGGNDPRKGVADVLALAHGAGLTVLGAGPRSQELRFGARPGLGYVRMRDVLAACDVVVAPTVFDAAPVAVLEAVAAGLPVVSGVSSGWAEPLTRFGAGAAWRPGSSLAAAIRSVLPGSREAARAFTDSFSEAALAARLRPLWASLA
ncbi:MAG: glycosyltransferase family 4 protein [Solirubrobacteraceae bacterium]